jgi:hypothetical protein
LGCNLLKNDGRKAAQATTGVIPEYAARRYRPWTEQDIQLVLNRTDLTLAELAEMLGRSSRAIRAIRYRLENKRGGSRFDGEQRG